MRLSRIQNSDLHLFDFDYDLTLMVFFLREDEQVYARYSGRGPDSPDTRQSLAGLKHTMAAVLGNHRSAQPTFAPRRTAGPGFLKDLAPGSGGGRCIHCHNVREMLNERSHRDGTWSVDSVWRYPLPDNLGLVVEVDRGNIVQEVRPSSPADQAGLRAGDTLRRLHEVPIHSFADVQYGLDLAPKTGTIPIAWRRGSEELQASLALPPEWRRTDITWRQSLYSYVPTFTFVGDDVAAEEKQKLRLHPQQTAFRQDRQVGPDGQGVRAGDIVLGFNGQDSRLEAMEFRWHIVRSFVIGEQIRVNVIRDGQRLEVPLKVY